MRISDWSSDVCSSDLQYLPIRGDADLHPAQRRAHGVELDLVGTVAAHHRGRFGLAVALEQAQAERGEEEPDLDVERRAAGYQRLDPATEPLAPLGIGRPSWRERV